VLISKSSAARQIVSEPDAVTSCVLPFARANIQPMPQKPSRNASLGQFNPEIENLCDEFLRQSSAFASRFVSLARVSSDVAPGIEGMILTRCSEVIAKAQVSLLGER
jgi:hypothetical protein